MFLAGTISHFHAECIIYYKPVNDICTAVTVSVLPMVSVGEEDGMVQVCATLSALEDIERDLAILLATNNGTGKHVSHYYSKLLFILLLRQHSLVLTMKLLALM